jgi:hypothetical protein
MNCYEEIRPHIANCGFDGVGEMFTKIIPGQDANPLKPRNYDWESQGELLLFDQQEFVNSSLTNGTTGLNEDGYVYIPNSCKSVDTPTCRVHIALHGCS